MMSKNFLEDTFNLYLNSMQIAEMLSAEFLRNEC
jgi:hypothetical protein